jgi:UPF0755 protein
VTGQRIGWRIIRKLVVFVFSLVAICIVLGTVAGGILVYLNNPVEMIPEGGVFFHVEKGENLREISYRLERKELIRSAAFLVFLSKVMGTESSFQAGPYKIVPDSTTNDIHNLLTSGNRKRIRITIPEGWTTAKIAALLDSKGIVDQDEFREMVNSKQLLGDLGIHAESFEGYLFPDTYFIPEFSTSDVIIEIMVANFYKVMREILPDYEQWDREELHKEIILASIVEREYRIEKEAPLIASVFKNRMKYRIGLESCATLEYIITEIQGKPHPEYLTLEHTAIDSPYNTYKWAGLPPGPISNPGRVALNATFHSADTDYYYFLLKDPETGEHYFSENLDEHNEAKYFYLKNVAAP